MTRIDCNVPGSHGPRSNSRGRQRNTGHVPSKRDCGQRRYLIFVRSAETAGFPIAIKSRGNYRPRLAAVRYDRDSDDEIQKP